MGHRPTDQARTQTNPNIWRLFEHFCPLEDAQTAHQACTTGPGWWLSFWSNTFNSSISVFDRPFWGGEIRDNTSQHTRRLVEGWPKMHRSMVWEENWGIHGDTDGYSILGAWDHFVKVTKTDLHTCNQYIYIYIYIYWYIYIYLGGRKNPRGSKRLFPPKWRHLFKLIDVVDQTQNSKTVLSSAIEILESSAGSWNPKDRLVSTMEWWMMGFKKKNPRQSSGVSRAAPGVEIDGVKGRMRKKGETKTI